MARIDSPVTLRTCKVVRNRLMERMQMVVNITHPNRPNVSSTELRNRLSELYQTPSDRIVVFGLRTQHGGGSSTAFALVYDSHDALKKCEPPYRLVRLGYASRTVRPCRIHRAHLTNWAGRFHGREKARWNLKAGRGPGWRGRSIVVNGGRGLNSRRERN